jgi:hypothetical protein
MIKRFRTQFHQEEFLTDETLQRLGFSVAVDSMGFQVWRLSVPYYYKIIQISINPDLPRTNPNCGVFSLYSPAQTIDGINENGDPEPITFPETTTNVAWYADTCERLYNLIKHITHVNLY